VSEIYGSSGGYDRSNDAPRGYERSSYPVDENGQECWAEDAEPMGRAARADYVREGEQGGIDDADADDPWDTDPDLENYANGNYPEIAWRNQGNPDSPNGFGRLDTTDLDGVPETGDDGDMWGDTYPDDAADYADTGTATGTLMAGLDHAPAETPDRPPANIEAALAADTTPTRQEAARDDGPGREGQGGDDTASRPHDDPVDGHDADIYAIPHENDHLPQPRTRQEAAREGRQAEADRKQDPGLTELSTVADDEAYRSWEDGLPSRDESREKTWGPDAEFWDENEQAWRKSDSRPAPGANPDDATLVGDNAKPRMEAEHHDPGEVTNQSDAGTGVPDQAAETGTVWRQRVAELEAENAQLGKDVANVKAENAELHRGMSALEARMERLEQTKASDPALKSAQDSGLRAAENATEKSERPAGRREWTSNEAIGLAAMTGSGVLTTVSDFWSYLPATYAGITASVLGVGAAAVALVRKHREARDAAHRP
jgi:hypothetical protein